MDHFKLSDYKIKKGVLISPWNEFMTPLSKGPFLVFRKTT